MPFVARYRSTNPKRTMLGGVMESETSRFESPNDALDRLSGVIDIHAKLPEPLTVVGEVVEVPGSIEIYRDGSTKGCKWGRAAQAAKKQLIARY